jgi:eukaryotic-like serine/threonine-protein kinase
MSLSAGTRFGPYEIVVPIGSGGMGEVYRARDTRLGRDVAVKVIRACFAADTDQLRRFEKEARAAAQLDHPSILVVHDVGTHEGSPYIVSELLEGGSLREKLGAPLPPKKAVEYAMQVAHGLAAAHEKGIVHRDLKPENLFVTRDGRIKILDFGVAKLTQPASPSVSATEALTAAPGTEPGVVMGTVGYMSPEQVLGKQLDARSDLFSLGVVLYEMLSGKRPFQKDTAPETMASILREEPPELSGTNKAVPPGLERVVRHCLEKDPTGRFQTARDVAFALESLSQATTVGSAAPRRVTRRRKAIAAAAFFLLAAALLAAGALLHSRLSEPALPSIHRLTFQRGRVTAARFLPDGQTVAYAAAWGEEPLQLYSLRFGSPESGPLGFKEADLLGVSRASELGLGLAAPGQTLPRLWSTLLTLAIVPFSGGAPRPLEERVFLADFSPDSRMMAVVKEAPSGRGDRQLEYPAGTVLFREPGFWVDSVRVSSRGDQVAFVAHARSDSGGTVMVVAPGGTARKVTGTFVDIGGLAWSPNGREIWFTAAKKGARRELLGVDLSGRERRLYTGLGSILLHDISGDGRVLVSTKDDRARLFFGGVDVPGNRELSWFDFSAGGSLSHDGKVVFFAESGEAAGTSRLLFVREADGSPPRRIATGRAGGNAAISPDGRFVVQTWAGPPSIQLIPVGAGATRKILLTGFDEDPVRAANLLADGNTVWFVGAKAGSGLRYWITDLDSTVPQPASSEIKRSVAPFITPDEKNFFGRIEGDRIALLPRSGGEPRVVAGVSEADLIAGATPDGQSLFVYRPGDRFPATVRRVNTQTGRSERLLEISPPDRTAARLWRVHVTPDGRNYSYVVSQRLGELYVIEGLK